MIICVYVYILYYIPSASPVQHPDTSARGPCRARHLLGNVSPEHGSSVGEPRIPARCAVGFWSLCVGNDPANLWKSGYLTDRHGIDGP